MGITMEIHKGVLMVKISGEFDMQIAEPFKNTVDQYLVQAELKDLIVDMREVPFIDSSGIGVLLGRYKKVLYMGGKIAMVGVQEPVEKILKLSGVLGIIPSYENETEALMCF